MMTFLLTNGDYFAIGGIGLDQNGAFDACLAELGIEEGSDDAQTLRAGVLALVTGSERRAKARRPLARRAGSEPEPEPDQSIEAHDDDDEPLFSATPPDQRLRGTVLLSGNASGSSRLHALEGSAPDV